MKSWCDLEPGKPVSSHIHQRPAVNASVVKAPTAICLERNRCREGAAQVPEFSIEHMAEVFEWPSTLGKTWEAQDEMKKTEDNPWRFLWKLSVCWFVFVKTFVSTDSVSSFWQILPPTIGLTASRRVSVALLMRKNLQWNKWKATSPIPKMNFGDQYRRRRFFNVFFQWSVDRIPWKVKGCTRIAEAYIYRRVLLWLDGMWRVMLISTLTQFLWESKEIRRNGCIYCVRKRTCWKMFAHIPFQWFSSVRETTSGRCFWDDPKID